MRRIHAAPHRNAVFRHLTQRLPWAKLARLVEQHGAGTGVRRLFTRDLLNVMLFTHLAAAKGLRDVPAPLASQDARRCHAGLPQVARSTLADAPAIRPADVFAALIPQVTGPLARGIGECLRLIDSTTPQLNPFSAPCGRFSAGLCAAKAHIVLDPNANCPLTLAITAAQAMPIDPGATYCFDLGYDDYAWRAKLDDAGCRIVTRLKANTPLRVIETRAVPATASDAGIQSDQIGFLPARQAASRRNPMANAVRAVQVAIQPGTVLRILSNDLDAPATEPAAIDKRHWDIELFVRWIKQTPKLRHFHSTSENGIRIQIAVAMIAFILPRLVHGVHQRVTGLTAFARLVRANLLHRTTLTQLRGETRQPTGNKPPVQNTAQGILL